MVDSLAGLEPADMDPLARVNAAIKVGATIACRLIRNRRCGLASRQVLLVRSGGRWAVTRAQPFATMP